MGDTPRRESAAVVWPSGVTTAYAYAGARPKEVTVTAGSTQLTVRNLEYLPFGLATPNEDPDGDGQTFALDVRFPGQARDGESGLHDNFYRTYDPTTGRYLDADPLGVAAGPNPYRYAWSNPLRFYDPDGQDAREKLGALWSPESVPGFRKAIAADLPEPGGRVQDGDRLEKLA